jgi:cation diffusion facilitator CzcD-associated flavoprotein CzcO
MTTLPKSCIIGAGCSGFTTAKALQDRGLPFDIFEMTGDIGGTWNFNNPGGASACYQSLHIDTSKTRMQFADFPIPANYPDYPHHAQVLSYFNAYVDNFDLRRKITFNTKVEKAVRGADGVWSVTLSTGETRRYDALFVCNGHHWDPNTPEFPGTFTGIEMHSHAYRTPFSPHDLVGKNVLVVGMGNSAMDIASELAQKPIAKKLMVAARRGVWIFPKYINGHPPDKGAAPPWLPNWLYRFVMKRMVVKAVGHMKNYGLPEPEHHPADAHPSVSGEFLTRAGCGDVHMKPNIAEKMGHQVKFTDGTIEDVDAIIYATGYNITFPFLDGETAPVVDNHIGLFKRIWRPGVPNLFFMGLAQPLPTLVNFAERQAKWIAAFLMGEYVLPSAAEMEKTITADEDAAMGRYYKSRRHTMQVNFDKYCIDIQMEQARGSARAKAEGGGKLPVPALADAVPPSASQAA